MVPGDLAPDFELTDDEGNQRSLSQFLTNGPVVLFFYPAAMTAGCTAESCHFRDLAKEFAEAGAQRVGISPDTVDKQAQFSAAHSFDFPLLSDRDGAVATQFGVRRRFGPMLTRRQTFVIDTDRRILDVIKSEVRMSVHADRALAALRDRV
jgi:thioredoxin-dependent peroxiredoxin